MSSALPRQKSWDTPVKEDKVIENRVTTVEKKNKSADT